MAKDDLQGSELFQVAENLVGQPICQIERVSGGGNNRLYKVMCAEDSFALKKYPPSKYDPRDRLGVEYGALRFFDRHGVTPVPKPYEINADLGYCLMEWIEGERIDRIGVEEIQAAVDFINSLWRLNSASGATDMPPASEACLSGSEIMRQIRARIDRLSLISANQPGLRKFLRDTLSPAIELHYENAVGGYRCRNYDFGEMLEPAKRCLIPADFGYHNALRRADGSVVFLDFEYFGWDDSVKLVADFLLHPAMTLGGEEKHQFFNGLRESRTDDEFFVDRLRLLFPLIAVRWALILLNEFLPDHWERRHFAGAQADWESAKARQLERAHQFWEDFSTGYEKWDYE